MGKESIKRIISALIVGAAMAGLGYAMGQYAPFTGLAQIAEPFSPIRDQTATSYAAIAGIIGCFLGLSIKDDKKLKLEPEPVKELCATCGKDVEDGGYCEP